MYGKDRVSVSCGPAFIIGFADQDGGINCERSEIRRYRVVPQFIIRIAECWRDRIAPHGAAPGRSRKVIGCDIVAVLQAREAARKRRVGPSIKASGIVHGYGQGGLRGGPRDCQTKTSACARGAVAHRYGNHSRAELIGLRCDGHSPIGAAAAKDDVVG